MPACERSLASVIDSCVAAAAAAMLLSGCAHRPVGKAAPAAVPRYVVGRGYQAGGTWYYPAERFEYAQSGIATVDEHRPAGLTADGELYDPQALAAAHQTLQLPAVVRVTDLDNGRQVELRLNDRGPADPRRLIALTPRAGELLDIPPGGAARVIVATDPVLSRALAEQLGGGPRVAIEAAPEAAVTAEALPPPGGAPSAEPTSAHAPAEPTSAHAPAEPTSAHAPAEPTSAHAPAAALGAVDAAPASITVPARMPERVQRVGVSPGALYLELGRFSRFTYAHQRAARLGGIDARVERQSEGRVESYDVRAGPFATIAEADDAMDQAIAAGVTDARIRIR